MVFGSNSTQPMVVADPQMYSVQATWNTVPQKPAKYGAKIQGWDSKEKINYKCEIHISIN